MRMIHPSEYILHQDKFLTLMVRKEYKLKTLSIVSEQRQKRKDTTHFVNLCIN